MGRTQGYPTRQGDNDSFEATTENLPQRDDFGAMCYIIAVILIYGCSILVMIASYIRKNKMDRKLNRCLKEMANVRRWERKIQQIKVIPRVLEPQDSISTKLSDISELSHVTEDGEYPDEEDAQPRSLNVRDNRNSPFASNSSLSPTPVSDWDCSSVSDLNASPTPQRSSRPNTGEVTSSPQRHKKGKMNWNTSPYFNTKKAGKYQVQQQYLDVPRLEYAGANLSNSSYITGSADLSNVSYVTGSAHLSNISYITGSGTDYQSDTSKRCQRVSTV